MLDWLQQNELLLWWAALISVLTFVLSLLIVPVILVYLPADYFSVARRSRRRSFATHPFIALSLLLVKNLLGTILLLAGILMLALPGQGLLTIAVALMLLDFPGKYRAERWLVTRQQVRQAINWVRLQAGRPELLLDEDDQVQD